MSERLQKVLAAAGICSRREAENWISAARVQVNGRTAKLGDRIDEGDQLKIDGKRVRLERQAPEDLLVIYHRDPGEPLRSSDATLLGESVVMDRLPSVRGRRWLPLAPLSPSDGGLEAFSTDGQLRAAFSRHSAVLSSRYALRLGGDWEHIEPEALEAQVRQFASGFELLQWSLTESEGRNRWVECEIKGAHGRELRQLLSSLGFEVSRILRLSLGPLQLERTLSRRRSLEIKGTQRSAVYEAVGLLAPKAKLSGEQVSHPKARANEVKNASAKRRAKARPAYADLPSASPKMARPASRQRRGR